MQSMASHNLTFGLSLVSPLYVFDSEQMTHLFQKICGILIHLTTVVVS